MQRHHRRAGAARGQAEAGTVRGDAPLDRGRRQRAGEVGRVDEVERLVRPHAARAVVLRRDEPHRHIHVRCRRLRCNV